MNKRRIGILCLLLIGSLFLNGCQLAMEEGDNGGNDRFCGFYITFEIYFGLVDRAKMRLIS